MSRGATGLLMSDWTMTWRLMSDWAMTRRLMTGRLMSDWAMTRRLMSDWAMSDWAMSDWAMTGPSVKVKTAARMFGVPRTTLRDRVSGHVNHDKAVSQIYMYGENEKRKQC
ncbi:hypothetical protein DPMN_115697 [Dreissena polymorpha]|uniref:HTH psq-type domain-containing protein n=1 Tax=Dreissena polymorpha TaxID=45954 RepID=A0A9D4KNB0_DREPO|nr:hypothetical protein DPMN_115697 [Dreissena polymorpha]